jgi:hypothetical protein
MMRKIKRILTICAILFIPICAKAKANNNNDSIWNNVMDAIIQVESRGNAKAVDKSGTCVGILQMKKCLVDETNNILKRNKDERRYTYSDRYNPQKSKEMFVILQSHFNKEQNIERAIRSWNAGFYYEKKYGWSSLQRRTKSYHKKVMKYYKGD